MPGPERPDVPRAEHFRQPGKRPGKRVDAAGAGTNNAGVGSAGGPGGCVRE